MRRKSIPHLTIKVVIASVIFGILAFATALADGDTRLATQAEKEFSRTVLAVFSKVVLPGPQSWDQTRETTIIKELDRVTAGIDGIPLIIEYCIAWQDTKRITDANVLQSEEVVKLAQDPAKMTDKNIDELIKRTSPRDVTVRIDLYANRLSEGIYEKIKPAPSIAGGLVYRSESEYKPSAGWREGATYVFLGKGWKADNSAGSHTYVNFTPNKSLPRAVAQNIIVKVRADPNRALGILQKFDWEALKKLIKN